MTHRPVAVTGPPSILRRSLPLSMNFQQMSKRPIWLTVQAEWWIVDLLIAWALVWALTGPWDRWTCSTSGHAASIGLL